MPDEDKTFSGFLFLDSRTWWRHVHTLYNRCGQEPLLGASIFHTDPP